LRLARAWRAIAARAATAESPALLFAAHSAWRAALPLLRARPDIIRVGETRLRHALSFCLPEPILEPGARLFDAFAVGEQLAAARQQRIDLPGGGSATIEATRALTAIDIDSGSGDAEAAALAVARRLGRWLRLRDVTGTIMVDFPRVNAARRRVLEQAVAAGLSRDRRPVAALGWTRGGLYELSRSDDMTDP
jgi:ribonuclease G